MSFAVLTVEQESIMHSETNEPGECHVVPRWCVLYMYAYSILYTSYVTSKHQNQTGTSGLDRYENVALRTS